MSEGALGGVTRTAAESQAMAKQQQAAHARNAQAEMLAKLKRDDARIMDELLDSDDTAAEEERMSMDTIPLDDYRVADRTCGLRSHGDFSRTSLIFLSLFSLNVLFSLSLTLTFLSYSSHSCAQGSARRIPCA